MFLFVTGEGLMEEHYYFIKSILWPNLFHLNYV